RMVHNLSGTTTLQAYGQREHEVIYSVGRAALNRVLIESAACHELVSLRFNQTCVAADPGRNVLRFCSSGGAANSPAAPPSRSAGSPDSAATPNPAHGPSSSNSVEYETALTPTIATDGAGSAIRASLAATKRVTSREDWLDHDYKELTIPAQTARNVL